jgi:hypothetical protein
MKTNRRLARAAAPQGAARGYFPRLEPFPRCRCGQCRECQENDRWDRVFARLEVKKYWEDRGLFQSTLRGL